MINSPLHRVFKVQQVALVMPGVLPAELADLRHGFGSKHGIAATVCLVCVLSHAGLLGSMLSVVHERLHR